MWICRNESELVAEKKIGLIRLTSEKQFSSSFDCLVRFLDNHFIDVDDDVWPPTIMSYTDLLDSFWWMKLSKIAMVIFVFNFFFFHRNKFSAHFFLTSIIHKNISLGIIQRLYNLNFLVFLRVVQKKFFERTMRRCRWTFHSNLASLLVTGTTSNHQQQFNCLISHLTTILIITKIASQIHESLTIECNCDSCHSSFSNQKLTYCKMKMKMCVRRRVVDDNKRVKIS